MKFIVPVLVWLVTASASAQGRIIVHGLGGAALGGRSSPALAAGIGVDAGKWFQIVGELGLLREVESNDLQDRALDVERQIEESFRTEGFPIDVESSVKVRASYGMAGGRVVAPRGRARPFLGASAGFARVSPDFLIRFAGEDDDLTDQARDAGFLDDESVTRLLTAIGAGVTIPAARRVSVEIGYTWMRVFTEQAINVNRLYAAVGCRF